MNEEINRGFDRLTAVVIFMIFVAGFLGYELGRIETLREVTRQFDKMSCVETETK